MYNIQPTDTFRIQTSASPDPRFDTWEIKEITPDPHNEQKILVTAEVIVSQEGRPGRKQTHSVSTAATLEDLEQIFS
jgi:hypothetical protein